jgi:hypothetical protein
MTRRAATMSKSRCPARHTIGGTAVPLREHPQETQMQYMLLIYRDEAAMGRVSQAQIAETMGAFMAYTTALRESGAFVAGDRLDLASTATTVRVTDGKTQVLDGPYAETKEQLGGFYIIEAPDLDAALAWAGRCPGTRIGAVEVRPIPPMTYPAGAQPG